MNLLERWARGWRRRWAAVVLLAATATGIFVGITVKLWLHRGGVPAGVLAAATLGFWLWRRRGRVTALAVARHLNRTVPALEESADLLLLSDTALTPLERLQRDRVARTLGALVQPPTLPRRALYLGSVYALLVLLAAAGLSFAGGSPAHPAVHAAGRARAREALGPPQIVEVEVRLRPPGYTRQPERRGGDWDLNAEVGAQVTWRVRTDRPVRALEFVTSEGDTLRLQPRDRTTYEGSIAAEHSFLYQVAIQDSGTPAVSDYHRFTVVPDEPPTLTIVHPDPRTAIAPGSPLAVPLEVVASDDYGVADATIVATVTAGSGEAVKFREQVLDFGSIARHPDDRLLVLRRVLDLGALQMQPGDELYFYVLAHDRRTPQANAGRSDTYFITLTDTARVVLADLIGLAVTGLPEYLRSQRQIIIDTERLLAERAHLTTPVFQDRSNGIGFDQHALRDRYGELAGDETVTEGSEPTIEHEHDSPENATLLAPTVKDKLQAALAQMWDAELRLRTYDPSGALPYEYRALALLKEAQQATRAYVQRTGFEPTPLEPDRTRLTGTLTGIGNVALQRTDAAGPSLPAVRTALDAASRLFAGAPPRDGDDAILERGGREIARLAIAQPGEHLETLRALRGLIASLSDRGGPVCRECALRAVRGLWRALPPALPAAAARGSASGLARTYFERLRGRESP